MANVTGTTGDDSLTASNNDDTITGLIGNDILSGHATAVASTTDSIINTTGTGDQSAPKFVSFADGSYFAAWYDWSENTATVRGQYFNADGSFDGSEIVLGTADNGVADFNSNQQQFSVTALSNGDVAVGWLADSADVRYSVIDSTTQTTTTLDQVLNDNTGNMRAPVMTATPDGGFYAVYSVNNGAVFGRAFDATGAATGPATQLSTTDVDSTTNFHGNTYNTLLLSNGNVVVSWVSDGADGAGGSISQIIVDPTTNTLVSSEITVNQDETALDQNGGYLSATNDGGFINVWWDGGTDDTPSNALGDNTIRAQYFNADGTRNGSEFIVADDLTRGLNKEMQAAYVETLDDGNIVVSYVPTTTNNASFTIIDTTNQTTISQDVLISTNMTTGQQPAKIIAVDGGFFAAWQEENDDSIKGRFFLNDGTPTNSQIDIGTIVTEETPQFSGFSGDWFDFIDVQRVNGNVVVGWVSESGDSVDGDGMAAIQSFIPIPPELNFLDGDDSINGNSGDDTLVMGYENDTLVGGAGSDTVDASSGFATQTEWTTTYDSSTSTGSGSITGSTGTLGTQTISEVESFVASEANAGTDVFTLSNAISGGSVSGLDDNAVGTFTPSGGGAAIPFGPSETFQLSDVLAQNGSFAQDGTVQITSGDETGTLDGVSIANFETINFDLTAPICLASSTLVRTKNGLRPVGSLSVGDLVLTQHNEYQPVRWVGLARYADKQFEQNAKLRPVLIEKGALGHGLPERDMHVSRQHRMLVSSKLLESFTGEKEALVPAIKLTSLPGIYVDNEVKEIIYVHVLFDEHQIIYAEGAPTESLLMGPQALKMMSQEALEEISTLFPEALEEDILKVEPVIPILEGKAAAQIISKFRDFGQNLLT